MFKSLGLLGSLTLVLALSTTSAQAQSLEGQIARNPDDTVTYTLDLYGPPSGRARLFTSLFFLDPPYWSNLGPLWIDPSWWFPIGPFQQLPPSGMAQMQFTVPSPLTAGIPLCFQSLNIDTAGNLHFSNDAVALGHQAVATCDMTHQYSYYPSTETLDMHGTGPEGAKIKIVVENAFGLVDELTATVVDGKWQVDGEIEGGIHAGYRVKVYCNDQYIDTIRFHQ